MDDEKEKRDLLSFLLSPPADLTGLAARAVPTPVLAQTNRSAHLLRSGCISVPDLPARTVRLFHLASLHARLPTNGSRSFGARVLQPGFSRREGAPVLMEAIHRSQLGRVQLHAQGVQLGLIHQRW